MKTKLTRKQNRSAFTLIEMIGVLAVIAILAAVLIPKVFAAINNSRVNNAAMSCQTVKTAIADHYAEFGSLVSSNGTVLATPIANFDNILVTEGFLDKPFAVKISSATSNRVEVVAAEAATVDPTGANSAYNLDNTGATTVDLNKATGSAVVQAVIFGVTANDAIDFNDRVDGPDLGNPDPAQADLLGRVKYAAPSSGVTDVYVYLTHR